VTAAPEERSKRMKGPRPIGSILENWAPGDVRTDEASAVASAWPDAVGADVARRTRAGKLREGVLTIFTAGSTWSHQLTFLAPSIVAELNARCPGAHVKRLRFVVAAGRMKAMLDGLVRAPQHRSAQAAKPDRLPVDDAPDAAEDVIRMLRRRQEALDRRRQRDGWTRCASCGNWKPPVRDDSQPCAVCAAAERRAADGRIERVLVSAPWLGAADVASHVDDADPEAFDRVRLRLLARWEEQIVAMRARLRRRALLAADRVLAWSYLMLRSGMQQHLIGRAVVSDALGDEWADALCGPRNAAAAATDREATGASSRKQKKMNARAFTAGDSTSRGPLG
jgi:Dna[CI] antecedent DciA-like protein